jgi:hypothetical protein
MKSMSVGKRKKEKMKKMKTRYLPAIASILIIAIAMTSLAPVFAALPTRLIAQPILTVVTIAQDDQSRNTGTMWFGTGTTPATLGTGPQELMSQFKVFVSYNGVPVTPTTTHCQFVEKDKVNPLKPGPQGLWENLVSKPVENNNFVCKFRWGKPGVGVIDVYYVGALSAQYIADYILVVSAGLAVGRTTVMGTEIQDICVLAFPAPTGPTTIVASSWLITKPDGTVHPIYADPLGAYVSCEDAALQEQAMLGLPILWQ